MEPDTADDMGDVSISIDEMSIRSNATIPEKHLSAPIIVSLLERLMFTIDMTLVESKNVRPTTHDPRRTHAVSKFLRRHPEYSYSSIRKPAMQYSDALDYCLKPPEILTPDKYPSLYQLGVESSYRLHNDLRMARQIFERELNAYMKQMSGILSEDDQSALRKKLEIPCKFNWKVIESAGRAQLWSDIVETYRRDYKKTSTRKKHTIGPVRFVCCDGFLLLKTDFFDTWQLLVFEQLQMIQDCCLARHNVELSLRFKFHNGTDKLRNHVRDIISWQERAMVKYGNNGFDLVKAPEAIFKARLNTLTDGDLLKYSSYDRTLDKMKAKERKIDPARRVELIDELDVIVKSVTNIYDAAELFGLSKLSGHPTVYAERSLRSVKKEATPKGTIQMNAVRQIERMFKHITLSGYITYNQSWPEFVCPPALNTTLRRHYINRVTSLPLGSYPMSDLDAIVFEKFVEYDYSEDYLKFLDDKAICPGAAEMSKFWFSGSRIESRRLLQKIIEIEEFDTVAMVERLRRGQFTADELVVELTQKERELKPEARCFCKLPIEVRTFFTSTEYNLKEQFMSKYIPQQTMTMSSTETKTRLYNLVKNAKNRDRTLLEVDFSRWNLRWREQTVNGIASILEDIFGMPGVFSQAHKFFTRATVVITDKHKLPAGADPSIPVTEWPESDLLYRGSHLGGFEGIQQALWTICTIAMMYWVLHDQNVAFMMAGQGDNQIFALTFSTTEVPSDIQLRKLLAIMEIRCKLLNHEVKPDECIDSSTVLTYSKDIYVEGNHILYNLKFSSRTFKREEVDMPSLSTEIAAISACSMACADSVYITPRAIFWKTYQTLRFLSQRLNSPNYPIERNVLADILSNDELLEFVLLLPGSLGGLPIMQWSRFFMKGEVDDLTWDVAAVRGLASEFPLLIKDLKLTMRGQYSPKRPKLEQLILDPHSIPIERPKDLKRLVKDAVAEKLPSKTRNRWIRNVFSESAVAAGDEFITALTKTEPFYPQIMSDLYALTPSGVRDALLSRFTMTRTINSITGNPNFSIEISMANARLLRFLITRYNRSVQQKSVAIEQSTIHAICQKLRSLWGPNVKQECIAVYNPFDFRLTYDDGQSPMIFASSRTSGEDLYNTLGPYPPNFGTRTRQKVSDHGFKIVTSSSTIADLKKIILTLSELGGTPELMRLLDKVTRARSPWSATQLSTVLPTSFGGTAAHRHQAINAAAFSLLGSRTVPTHLNFCSDRAGILSGGEFDYPIAFQEFYLVLTNIYQTLTYCKVLNTNASIGFVMTDQYDAIPDDPVICNAEPTKLPWNVDPSNKLIYATALMVREIPVIPPPAIVPHKKATSVRPDELLMNIILQTFIKKRRFLTGSSLVNHPIELFDFKEFNHCSLHDLLHALSWAIQVLAISTAVEEFTKDAHVMLKDYVFRICNKVSPLVTRLMLHPDFQKSQFAVDNFIHMEPGASGARDASERLAGYLYETTMLSISGRTLVSRNPCLILFGDYESIMQQVAYQYTVAFLALQSRDTNRILLTSHQRLLLRSSRAGIAANTESLHVVLNLKSTLQVISDAAPQSGYRPEGVVISPVYELAYISETPQEAIRALRGLPRDVRLQCPVRAYDKIGWSLGKGACKFEITDQAGHLRPMHVCPDSHPTVRFLDNFCSKLTRTVGEYSSALSVWLTVLAPEQRLIRGKRVSAIGVGHGATSVAALNFGAREVYGTDLRSSFPVTIQREGTYLPPEVTNSGYSNFFKWSEYTARLGGDIFQLSPENRHLLGGSDCVILDIEVPATDMTSVLMALPETELLVVRLQCCSEWIRYYADMLQADRIVNTSVIRASHNQSYILVVRGSKPRTRLANYSRYKLLSTSAWSCTTPKDMKGFARSVNKFYGKLGESLKQISGPELSNLAQRLETRGLNSNASLLSDKLLTEARYTRIMIDLFRNHETITVEALESLDRNHRSLLGQWISHSGFDASTIISRLEIVALSLASEVTGGDLIVP